jgi:hypothetical protein
VPLSSFSPLRSALKSTPSLSCPTISSWTPTQFSPVPFPRLSSQSFPLPLSLLPTSLESSCPHHLLLSAKTSALTSTRSSNFLGFVSSFTRCCWSTAPWLRHLRMLSASGKVPAQSSPYSGHPYLQGFPDRGRGRPEERE